MTSISKWLREKPLTRIELIFILGSMLLFEMLRDYNIPIVFIFGYVLTGSVIVHVWLDKEEED